MPNQKSQYQLVKHFIESNHNFQKHAEYTLIEQIRKQMATEETRKLLKKRENFWILKLQNLYQNILNEELNIID